MKIIEDKNIKKFDIDNYTENKNGLSDDVVYISKNQNLCLKVYSNSKYSKNNYKMELKNLKLLNNLDHFPKYIGTNDNKILTEYCGEKISKNNIPNDYIEQINDIINIFKIFCISHNDIHPDNILVKNNKIFLIDFAFMDYINKSKCHLIPINMKEDVINNMNNIDIRLKSEKECFLLSIDCISTDRNYWDYIYVNINSFSLDVLKTTVKDYYYKKIEKIKNEI